MTSNFFFIDIASKDGELEKYRMNKSNINYYRGWVNESGEKNKTVFFMTNGKQIVCENPTIDIDVILGCKEN